MRAKHIAGLLLSAAASLLLCPTMQAQSPTEVAGPPASPSAPPAPDPAAKDSDGPRFELTIWMWTLGLDGDVGLGPLNVSVSESFVDIVDASDSLAAFSGRFEFGVGRFGAYVDGMYADITAEDQSGPGGLGSVDVEFEQTILDFGAMYRVGIWEPSGEAAKNSRDMTLDLYGGGRYSSLDVELRPANLAARSDRKDWVDPILGAKFVAPFTENWHIAVNADIGGFGVESDITWSATAVFGYGFHLWDCPACVLFGYRAMAWDFSEGSGPTQFTWDVVEHGPILGFSLQF